MTIIGLSHACGEAEFARLGARAISCEGVDPISKFSNHREKSHKRKGE